MTDAPDSDAANAARQRLDRLDGFLRQDPSNNALLIDAFDTALAQTPQPPEGFGAVLLHNLAFVDLKQDRVRECIARLAPAVEQRQPEDGRAWSTRGFAALLAGDLASARAGFVRALSAMATHIGTWHGLAWTQMLQHDLKAARTSFETALELDRNFAESQGGLAVVLAMMQLRPEAETHAALALRLDKRNLSGRYATALLSGEVGDAEDLQRLAERLLAGRAAPLGGGKADLLKPRGQ